MTTVLIGAGTGFVPASTIDWPADAALRPAAVTFGVRPVAARWEAVYTRQRQQASMLADRLTCSVSLPPCGAAQAGQREAWLAYLLEAAPWVRLRAFQRPVPLGTLRGTLTAAAQAPAGARTLVLNTGQPGATLQGGDVLGSGGRLLLVAYAGAVADGTGLMTVPLALPLRLTIAAGAAVTWSQPTGTFQVDSLAELQYTPGLVQQGFELAFTEVV